MDLGTLHSPVLIFGGPYSNLAATQAMQAEAARLGIPAQQVICTGDLVAYCAEPEATVQLIRDWGISVVMGNCEESLAQNAPDCGCGFDQGSACSLLSVEWYNFSNKRLPADDKQWMSTLPRRLTFSLNGQRFTVVHGSYERINEFVFASEDKALKVHQRQLAESDVLIGGHCGLPFCTALGTGYWLNSGVIGMPANDGTRDDWYMLLQPVDGQINVSWHRLAYDANHAAERMRQAMLSDAYANALMTGLWPSVDILPAAEQAQTGTRLEIAPLLMTP
ncbi:MAG: diadenosine tetraphosphatase [Neptuniibacter sp. Phe_28]|nr:MAG: diadenosine tetraphosphatase [Neptuniibacter sp. Phe_28]